MRYADTALKAIETRTVLPPEKTVRPFYSTPAWRQLMAHIIRKRGRRCEERGCGRKGCRVYGDHIIELEDGGEPLDEKNILLRCGSCHTTKTMVERKQRALSKPGDSEQEKIEGPRNLSAEEGAKGAGLHPGDRRLGSRHDFDGHGIDEDMLEAVLQGRAKEWARPGS